MHVYATTYPDSTKNAPTTTFTCDSNLSVSASFVQHAMKWPTAMYEMRKKRVESSAGMNGRFFFAPGDARAGSGDEGVGPSEPPDAPFVAMAETTFRGRRRVGRATSRTRRHFTPTPREPESPIGIGTSDAARRAAARGEETSARGVGGARAPIVMPPARPMT